MIGQRLNGFRYKQAIIGFGGEPTLWWMRFLKKGFYHCLIALGDNDNWILIDPLLSQTDLVIIHDSDVETFLRLKGYKTIRTSVQKPKRRLVPMPCTCVETVKRFCGISSFFIWTPYQLYCFFHKNKKKILDIGKEM